MAFDDAIRSDQNRLIADRPDIIAVPGGRIRASVVYIWSRASKFRFLMTSVSKRRLVSDITSFVCSRVFCEDAMGMDCTTEGEPLKKGRSQLCTIRRFVAV